MRVMLIDTSGSLITEVEHAKKHIQVGDMVIMFDHKTHYCGVMNSQEEIDELEDCGGGGTDLLQAIELVGKICPNGLVSIYTDGGIFIDHKLSLAAKKFGMKLDKIIPSLNPIDGMIEKLEKMLS